MIKYSLFLVLFISNVYTSAHPTGDMVYTNNKLLWTYICPIGDVQHKACIMLWDEENGVRPWLTSDYSASDWMISVAGSKSVYLIERYYNQNESAHYSRLLFSQVEKEPTELVLWFKDDHRFGEHGFTVIDDSLIYFAKYPSLYKFNNDTSIEKVDNWGLPINSIRNTNDGNLLILSDSTIWLTDKHLNIFESWNDILEPPGNDIPFGGNRISDADFINGTLYISYWGKRRYDVLNKGIRETIMSLSSPWVPHHVALGGTKIFMLASTIAPDITNKIEPSLWLMENGNFELIWGDTGTVTDVKIKLENNDFELFQNYANPFNPSTLIRYSIRKKTRVQLDVFNISGERTRSLVNSIQTPGIYSIKFDASGLSSGIYIYRIQIEDFVKYRKMILLK
jgi:hypothetical protein